jgi:hypothetical protein
MDKETFTEMEWHYGSPSSARFPDPFSELPITLRDWDFSLTPTRTTVPVLYFLTFLLCWVCGLFTPPPVPSEGEMPCYTKPAKLQHHMTQYHVASMANSQLR